MRALLLLTIAALGLAACAPKPAAGPATSAGINATADCAAAGQAPGSAGYQDCVNALASANAAIGADAAQVRAQIDQQRAQMQAEMDQQRAQMNQTMQNAQNSIAGAGCVTTRDANNNVSTQCP